MPTNARGEQGHLEMGISDGPVMGDQIIRGVTSADELEPITPSKICTTLLLRNYILVLKNLVDDDHTNSCAIGLSSSRHNLTSRQRKNFCLLSIKLIQGVDRPLADLCHIIFPKDGASGDLWVTQSLFEEWRNDILTIVNEGVGGLMDLTLSLEKMVSAEVQVPLLHRASVVGLFLRRMVLCFERLGFSDISNIYHNFRKYYRQGKATLEKHLDAVTSGLRLSEPSHSDLDMGSFSLEVASINQEASESDVLVGKVSRKQAELYIANQVELLQKGEVYAHSPDKIAKVVARIVEHNPDLAEAHFLSYLNHMRVNEFCGAMGSINKCFVGPKTPSMLEHGACEPMNVEDINKGFRYAALNLAAMHARFNHKREAVAALREAVMMAQQANDHVCLQHALSWLYRVQPENRMTLIERCISKTNEYSLSYLCSLGIQALSQFAAIVGCAPSAVIEMLTGSDVLNCQHSIIELVTASYAQKASLWTLYGKTHMSCTVSQLLLHLDTSDWMRDGMYVTAEATAISLSNLARHLHDNGWEKPCDKVLSLAKTLFPNEASRCGGLWRWTRLQVEFQRALFQTEWAAAEETILSSIAYAEADPNLKFDPAFMKFQLHLCKGDRSSASEIQRTLRMDYKDLTASDQVRLHLLEAELACLTETYACAIPSLLTAKEICDRCNLDFLGAIVVLHLAHIQFQLGMGKRALKLIHGCLPTIFANGSLYECSRGRLLLAKCLVATAPRTTTYSKTGEVVEVLERRSDVHKAIAHLKEAAKDFATMRAYNRTKDVLYMMARLYHFVDMLEERNRTAAEFKKIDEQHPTHSASHLATVL